MSDHLVVYLGPFVTCSFRDEMRDAEVYGCTNETCVQHKRRPVISRSFRSGDKFCSLCGSPNDRGTISIPYKPSVSDALGDRENDLMTLAEGGDQYATAVHLGSNHYDVPRGFCIEPDSHIDIAAIDRDGEIAWFITRYPEAIQKLQQAYRDLRFVWGLHTFFR